jgi:hypothetical protein
MCHKIRIAINFYSGIGYEPVPIRIQGTGNKKKLFFNGFHWKSGNITRRRALLALSRFSVTPNALAIKTGRQADLIVIDCDTDKAVSLVQSIITDCPQVKTPRGNHFYFSYKDCIRTASYPDIGLDIRAEGGLVIVPPSRWAGGEYCWTKRLPDGELRPMQDDLLFLIKGFQKSEKTYKGRTARRKEKRFEQLSRKQQMWILRLINDCKTAPIGDRSGRDFYLCRFAACAGFSSSDLWPLVADIGKFKDRGKNYFDHTFMKAVQSMAFTNKS